MVSGDQQTGDQSEGAMTLESAHHAPPLVDVHTHFLPDFYVTAARAAGLEFPNGMPGWPSWSAEEHLRLMDQGGIGSAMLSLCTPGTHFGDDRAARQLTREVNQFGADLRRKHPARFGQFASLPLPDVEGALAEVAYAFDELGADGVIVDTNSRGRYLGDALFEPLWAELDRRQAIVFVHPTSPPHAEAVALGRPVPVLEFIFDSARAAADLVFSGTAARYPRISWVFTHGGGVLPLLASRIEQSRSFISGLGERSGVTVREQLSRFWYEMGGTPFPDQLPALLRAFGLDRLLYGGDYCWSPVHVVSAQIQSIDAAAGPDERETWRELTARNARRLLQRAASTSGGSRDNSTATKIPAATVTC
jgi:predicted TIM-barrel fold metal-dependent hydrolase